MYLSLYCKGSKRVTQGLHVRGSWWPNINCNILTPTLMAVNVVFLVLLMLNRTPWSSLCFLYCILSATSLDPNSSGPQAPSAWCGFPYHILSITPSPTLTGTGTSVLTELYNSSTPTWSPTRSLESNVGSSSSGNNCHAVQRSLSSGASVYECTMGIFLARPISSANFRPRDFLS